MSDEPNAELIPTVQPPSASAESFDFAQFQSALLDVNPWASELDLSKDDRTLRSRRRSACLRRLEGGIALWNTWAHAMILLREKLENHDKWGVVDTTGYWARRWAEPRICEATNEETRLWLLLAYSDFRGIKFKPSPDFVRFHFPALADFRSSRKARTIFPDGVNFAGAHFHDHALFEGTEFLGGGVTFEGATFCEEAFFQSAVFEGQTEINSASFQGMATFDAAVFREFVSFNRSKFEGSASFHEANFKDDAVFIGVNFEISVSFGYAIFDDVVAFNHARFGSEAYFYSAIFRTGASFIGAIFQEDAFFSPPAEEARKVSPPHYFGPMSFSRTVFEKFVTFAGATFHDDVDFSALQAKSSFSLVGTTFQQIPDFTQADFKQSPALDQARFIVGRGASQRWSDLRQHAFGRATPASASELPARFRALKRLAIQGHHYARELEFHAGEMKTRRGVFDKMLGPNAGSYWFGLLYQSTSDFGRSLARPLIWWMSAAVAFAAAYWSLRTGNVSQCSSVSASAYLSARKAVAVVNLETSEKLREAYVCLYGVHASAVGPRNLMPHVPHVVEGLTVLQTLLSGVFLFLFALALRNRFRIT